MAGNSFGKLFRVTTFGESHGPALGVVIDGCPAGLKLDLTKVQAELDRRKPGQSTLVTQRKEVDKFELLSGCFEGKTTGAPLAFLVRNSDVRSKDYEEIKNLFRPGHADFTYFAKYGHRDFRGGGRSSARETLARVIAGAVAKQILKSVAAIQIRACVVQIGSVSAQNYQWDQVEQNELRSVDATAIEAMREEVESAKKNRDSVGGKVEIQALNVPPGLGEPVFDKIDAALASALMSIPAVKAVELGVGVKAAELKGSEMNDEMLPNGFKSNNHGGVLGGVTSGAPIVARITLKPTSSIPQEKTTIDTNYKSTTIKTLGRHDPCVAIRAVPIAEAMVALVLVDFWLEQAAAIKAKESFAPLTEHRYGLADDD